MAISRMQQQRQMYGLGSLVKKITKPIKKLAKSPVGKAALTAAALYGVNRFGIPGTSGFGKGSISDLLLGKMKSFGPAGKGFGTRSGGLLSKLFLKQGAGKFSLANLSPLKIGGIGALGGLTALGMGGDEEEETIDEAIARSYGKSDLDIPAIRKANKPIIITGKSILMPNCNNSFGIMAVKTLPRMVPIKSPRRLTLETNKNIIPMKSPAILNSPLISLRRKSEKLFDFFFN